MKKLIITILFAVLFFLPDMFSQENVVKPFVFDATKIYPNNTQISYFTIEGLNYNEALYVKDKINEEENIYRFKIFEKKSDNTFSFMIDCDDKLDEEDIYNQILKYQLNFKKLLNNIKNRPKYIDTGNPKKDKENYKKSKQEWIDSHVEEYKLMLEYHIVNN